MQRLTLGMDIENVLNDATAGFLTIYNERHGTRYTNSDCKQYSLYKIFNMKVKTVHQYFKEAYERRLVLPTETSIGEKVEDLRRLGRVVLLTNSQCGDTLVKSWVDENKIPYDELRVGNRWNFDKTEYGDVDVFIDDADYLASQCVKRKRRMFLYDMPWNRSFTERPPVTRISSLSDVPRLLAHKHAIQ
ncbi:MAG: hypothetical protein M1368_11760 [Thaumarchaeota archaeon]|nr:hypothetical protein [Nitrososphaerota archaeon]